MTETHPIETIVRQGRRSPGNNLRWLISNGAAMISTLTVLLAMFAVLFVPQFATLSNIRALLVSVSLIGIAAVGLSLITIVGRVFSLSIASSIAITTIVFANALQFGPWLALLISAVFGTIVGAIQGFIVGRFRTDPIITTIAFSAIILGAAQVWTSGRTIIGEGDTSGFTRNVFGIVPVQVIVFGIVVLLLFLWHRQTVAGRRISLIGLNEDAAKVTGLRSWPYVMLTFAICGLTTGIAGGLLGAQAGQGSVQLGSSFGFDVVVAVVVGGVSVKGGLGSPAGAAVGALFVGLLGNVLALSGLPYETQLVVQGALVLLAVILMGITEKSFKGRK